MIASRRPRAARALALALGLLPALSAGPAAGTSPDTWRISIRGQDVTRAADPRVASGVLLLNVVALGPVLALVARTAGREVQVRDASGTDWRGTAGDSLLSSTGRSLSLERPIRIDGPSAYLPATTIAELAGLPVDLDSGTRTAAFADRDEPAPSGWQSLYLPKQPGLTNDGGSIQRRHQDIFLPPDHDTLRVGLGLGVVPGADAGGEFSAVGSVRGIDTALSLLGTTGPRGFELLSGHAQLADATRGVGLEAGDLFSGIWGLAYGARVRWRRGEEEGASWPAVSIYQGDPGIGNPTTVVSYSDEIGLGRWSTAAGELASDGSWLASGRFRRRRLSLFGYLRNASGSLANGRGSGLSGSLDLPLGLELQGALSRSGSGDRRLDEQTLSLRVPLRQGSALTLATDRFAIGQTRGQIESVEGITAFGRLQVQERWQWRESLFSGFLSTPAQHFTEHDLFTTASYLVGTRLRIEAQLIERWPEKSRRNEWRQLSAALPLWHGSSLQVFASSSSSIGVGSSFRVRFDQEIRPGFSLFVEAGDIVTFQSETQIGPPDTNRFRIMVRRSWDVATPAPGNGVEGFVGSSGSLATAGLPVELGPYRTVTHSDGRYAFPNVPPGDYDLHLNEKGLPADILAGPPARVRVKRGESQEANLSIVPLGEARGWVYVDRNGNHRRDPNEGIAGVVMILDDRATVTSPDGSFGFFNLPPGTHRIRVQADRLPPGLEALIPSRMDLGLPAGRSVGELEFRLQEKHKSLVFQEARK